MASVTNGIQQMGQNISNKTKAMRQVNQLGAVRIRVKQRVFWQCGHICNTVGTRGRFCCTADVGVLPLVGEGTVATG